VNTEELIGDFSIIVQELTEFTETGDVEVM
jgi:hypothetical protein